MDARSQSDPQPGTAVAVVIEAATEAPKAASGVGSNRELGVTELYGVYASDPPCLGCIAGTKDAAVAGRAWHQRFLRCRHAAGLLQAPHNHAATVTPAVAVITCVVEMSQQAHSGYTEVWYLIVCTVRNSSGFKTIMSYFA